MLLALLSVNPAVRPIIATDVWLDLNCNPETAHAKQLWDSDNKEISANAALKVAQTAPLTLTHVKI